MSTTEKTLIERQNTTWHRMQEIMRGAEDEGRDLTAEERESWDKAEADLTQVSEDLDRVQRMARLAQVDRTQHVDAGAPGGEPEGDLRGGQEDVEKRYSEAFATYLRRGMGRLTADQRDLLEDHHEELRAQGTEVGTEGGFLVPEGFRNTITETMKDFGGLRELAEIITTDTGNDLPWPTNDDTANEGSYLGENEEVPDTEVTFGRRKMFAHIITSGKVLVPLALMQDSAFDTQAFLGRKLGMRIARRGARAWATGTGVDQPEGITTNTTVGKTGAAGQTTSIIYDDLIDLEHSVDPAYRNAGNSRYVFHDETLKVLRKLKDSDGRPLWVPVPAPGFPPTINSWAYTIDNSFPTPGASNKTMLFGDVRAGYIIREVRGMQMVRLDERFAEKLQVCFFAYARHDGKINDPAAIRLYEHAAA